MSPVMSNTTPGLVTVTAATDFSANVGLFAYINSSQQAAIPSANAWAGYIIEDAYSSPTAASGTPTYNVVLRPLSSAGNMRVIAAGVIACGGKVQTDVAGKAVAASTGSVILGTTEEACVATQYVLIRPVSGYATA